MLSFFACTNQYDKSTNKGFTLTKEGKSECTIIIPEEATTTEILAAKVFQDYIERISGAYIEIKNDNSTPEDGEILIGEVNRLDRDVPFEDLGPDGFYIRNNGKNLVISGGPKKGVIYGVYTFLERYMGCRKYSSTVVYIPKQKTIKLKDIDDVEIPAFSFREVFYSDVLDPEYMDWHKLHSHSGQATEWGSWVHTFGSLLNPQEYGESHPEYFSFYDGKRHPGTIPSWDGSSTQPESQLCLSNPKVLDIVCENLKNRMDKKPAALYWSVSHNDNVNYCKCPQCAALDAKYAAYAPEEKMYGTHAGSQYPALSMGSMLTFVNEVAERFPDKIISTLAYQHTRVPPKGIVPGKNVNIMLCSIESTRNAPIEQGDEAFRNDLEGWGKLTDNIIVWDYTIQFNNLLAPFPNLRTLQPNIKLFQSNRVSDVFEQGNMSKGGEFAELRAYLLAKLLWNPDINVENEMDDFLAGYYGKAGKYIKEYIVLLHDNNQANTGRKLSIFGSPVDEKETFLSQPLINQYNIIFDKAEKVIKENPELSNRVKSARLPIYYAVLEIAMSEKTGERGAFALDDDNNLKPKPEIIKILYDFVHHCVKTNVTRITEHHTTPKEYLEKYLKLLETEAN